MQRLLLLREARYEPANQYRDGREAFTPKSCSRPVESNFHALLINYPESHRHLAKSRLELGRLHDREVAP
ncbi:hypothetical protein D3C77_503750 [compost metagenome]